VEHIAHDYLNGLCMILLGTGAHALAAE